MISYSQLSSCGHAVSAEALGHRALVFFTFYENWGGLTNQYIMYVIHNILADISTSAVMVSEKKCKKEIVAIT